MIHQSEGLKIVENEKNGFVVCTLHYTADPLKRSEAWRQQAMKGMDSPRFAREYEIDYGAMFGERAFPEMLSHRSHIVIPQSKQPTFPNNQVYYGGFDYGMRSPSSFHVYTVWDEVVWAIWELYEPCKNIVEFSLKMRDCPYWEQIRYIAADPHIAALRHYGKDGNGASIRDQFAEHGIRKFLLSSTDEAAWMTMMKKHWGNPHEPTFRIYEECPKMIEEFTSMTFAQQRQAIGRTRIKEGLADFNNHAIDDCKYFMLTRPQAQQHKDFKFPIMTNRWKT